MRTQLVAARTVAEELVDLATGGSAPAASDRPKSPGLARSAWSEVAKLLASRKGGSGVTVQEMEADSDDPDMQVYQSGALLPGPEAKLAGPTFEQWLEERS